MVKGGAVIRETINQTLYAYWNDIRAGRLAPKRFEIEPSQIAALLPDTFILERVDSETSRFRLAGTRICEAFGTEFRGVNLLDLLCDEDRVTMQRQISVISRQGAVGVFTFISQNPAGQAVKWEMLILPLVHLHNDVDRYLGAVAVIDEPAWLRHEPLGKHRMLGNTLIWPDGRPHAMIDASHRQAPFLPQMREARIVRADRRHFRVYDGGLSNTTNDDRR
ncbi:MAG: PAS domain-containing protein [Hyphomicrobium sp.]|nr:PAS domain-containing protein [Hyphomicrobium sp.]